MPKSKTMVDFYCEQWSLVDLAMETGVSPETVRQRWIRLGLPKDITGHDEILSPFLRPGKAKRFLTVDGERKCLEDAARDAGVTKMTVLANIKKHGQSLTSKQLAPSAAGQAAGRAAKAIEPKGTAPAVPDHSPGWWERENLPDAGNNGFGKVPIDNFAGCNAAGIPIYTGVNR